MGRPRENGAITILSDRQGASGLLSGKCPNRGTTGQTNRKQTAGRSKSKVVSPSTGDWALPLGDHRRNLLTPPLSVPYNRAYLLITAGYSRGEFRCLPKVRCRA